MRLRMVRMIVIMQAMKRRRILNSGKLREKKPYYSLAVSNCLKRMLKRYVTISIKGIQAQTVTTRVMVTAEAATMRMGKPINTKMIPTNKSRKA